MCAHVKSVITADLSMLIGEFPGQIFFKMLDENDRTNIENKSMDINMRPVSFWVNIKKKQTSFFLFYKPANKEKSQAE